MKKRGIIGVLYQEISSFMLLVATQFIEANAREMK